MYTSYFTPVVLVVLEQLRVATHQFVSLMGRFEISSQVANVQFLTMASVESLHGPKIKQG